MKIDLLDCTLRDGGYINDWNFSDNQINKIINSLEESKADIIECGYLNDNGFNCDSTLFNNITIIDKFCNNKQSMKVVMINYLDFNISRLPNKESTKIDGIRLAFHKKNLEEAIAYARKIKEKGYKLFFQPMVTKNYSDLDFLKMLNQVEDLQPYAFYIVDSFGSMTLEEFTRYVNLSDNNLSTNIILGYHSHNNMQLAFSNAISLCTSKIKRDIIIDSSIYGIGRGAGNLNTEIIFDYLNKTFDKDYNIIPLLKVIDDFLMNLMRINPWGFSPAQFLSASFDCHPNYANYLINKNTKNINDINHILKLIPINKKNNFDKDLIEKIYVDNYFSCKENVFNQDFEFGKSKKILLIASGTSVKKSENSIIDKMSSGEYISISLNHKSNFNVDYYFFTNQKRFDEFKEIIDLEKTILSNNIITSNKVFSILDLQRIAYYKEVYFTNVSLIAINMLLQKKFSNVEIAGLDGYSIDKINNYNYNETTQVYDKKALIEENNIILQGLMLLNKKISINFITPSIFKDKTRFSILGVIPARFHSTRFDGKPLTLINGIPMIKRTYNQAKKSKLLDEIVIATEHEEIKLYCESENIPVIMTSNNCLTGTDRLAEVATKKHFDLYVNIQGDEPVIDPKSIDEIVNEYKLYKDNYVAYNLYKVTNECSEISSDTIIKVIVNEQDELMYMSRLGIPFNKSSKSITYKKQVCVYGFTKKALELFSSRNKTLNEQYEDIEILRFIDMGYKVKMKKTDVDSIAVDVPSDVRKVENYLNEKGLK